jgi:uncharacterized membrane protein
MTSLLSLCNGQPERAPHSCRYKLICAGGVAVLSGSLLCRLVMLHHFARTPYLVCAALIFPCLLDGLTQYSKVRQAIMGGALSQDFLRALE